MTSIENEKYKLTKPRITIITPVYNRRHTIMRTINSVLNQTFKDYEYIIIDDGSTDPCDDLIIPIMESNVIPIKYIKKEDGGVHSARNVGFKEGRGELIVCIDSDDELTPNACEWFIEAWDSIPNCDKNQYWQIKGQCLGDDGKITDKLYPAGFNRLPLKKQIKIMNRFVGEQLGCRVTNIMKNNLFPEPDGITYVSESLLWKQLNNKYKTIGLNKIVRLFHNDAGNRLSVSKKKSLQNCKNFLWNFYMSNCLKHKSSVKLTFISFLKYGIVKNILSKNEKDFVDKYRIRTKRSCIIRFLLWLPCKIFAPIYRKKDVIFKNEV